MPLMSFMLMRPTGAATEQQGARVCPAAVQQAGDAARGAAVGVQRALGGAA